MDQAPALPHPERGSGLARGRWSLAPKIGMRRVRVAPWQGNPYVALVGPVRAGRQPTPSEIRSCIAGIASRGVDQAVTPALSPYEAEPFYQAGFRLFERLHLLSCQTAYGAVDPVDSPAKLVAGRSRHNRAVLDVDARAFEGFWRFDKLALSEAKTATPARRFRVAKLNRKVVGYAVTGRAGRRGYLQRLAVDPAVQGQAIGTLLIHDSFEWLRRKGVDLSLVNTQETNARALSLYEHIGYRRQTEGLVVLRWDRGS